MKSREEREEEYYHSSARALASWLVDAEDDIRWILDTIGWAANQPDSTQLVSAQNFCRNLLDDYTK
jgi:hypothetical protein